MHLSNAGLIIVVLAEENGLTPPGCVNQTDICRICDMYICFLSVISNSIVPDTFRQIS